MQTKRGKLILVFVLTFFFLNIISATNTEIKIKTLPNHEVKLTTSKANTVDFQVIESFKETSDEYGHITFLTNCDDSEFNLVIFLKKDNQKITAKNFTNPLRLNNQVTGKPIYIEMAPSWFEFTVAPTNETEGILEENLSDNKTETIDKKENETTKEEIAIEETKEKISNESGENLMTGYNIYENFFSNNAIIYGFGVAGLFLILAFVFIFSKKRRLIKKKKDLEKLDKVLDEMDYRAGKDLEKKEDKKKDNKEKKGKKELVKDIKKKMGDLQKEIEELEKD